ncbi:hypothetical protein IW261DRAFT_1564216 [Armillaria novae-zelandiae]|uniref:Uncharacterized protein n=1 Tax=Armillaria novae-zelandiae TaxID=153914 RepID=A0AA39P8U2_9AGAR|nr:hypothetical protein IW261DRAFT_1564216 [Armillaria novae-zelandiae]
MFHVAGTGVQMGALRAIGSLPSWSLIQNPPLNTEVKTVNPVQVLTKCAIPKFSYSGARHLKACLMAHFPQEIIDAVIDEIRNSSPSPYLHNDLSCCSLVSHSFLPRSRKHLFSSIALTSSGHHSWATFHDRIFKPSPEIMPMILSVALRSGDGYHVEEDHIIYTLLAAMHNLRHVKLSAGFPGNGALSALKYHADNIISLHFTNVTFEHSGTFFDLLATFPNLRLLAIKKLGYKTTNPEMALGSRAESVRRLERFYFHATNYTEIAAFRELVEQEDIMCSLCLRQCALSLWDRDDIVRAKTILSGSLETLASLHLIYNTQINFCDILDILDFNLFNLPHLSITTFLPPNFRYTDIDEFEQGIRRCVLGEQLALEEFTLRVYPNDNCGAHSLWKVLDALLSGPRFPRFRQLEIELIFSYRRLADDVMKQIVQRQFTALNEKSGVQLSCRCSYGDSDDSRLDMYPDIL